MANYDLQYLKIPSKKSILGLAFPMRQDGVGGFLTQNQDLGSLRDCVKQLILTSRGARVMRPDYGTDIRKSVFEPLTSDLVEQLRSHINDTIKKYEPRVIVQRLILTPDYERNQLNIKMKITSKDDLLNAEMVEVLV